jgi:hypothetical protein
MISEKASAFGGSTCCVDVLPKLGRRRTSGDAAGSLGPT